MKFVRLSKGWSKQKLERTADLSKGQVSKIESGDRGKNPAHDTVEKLADALTVSVSYLTTGIEVPDGARVVGRVPPQPPLEAIPGYADAELAVARLETDVPIEIFKQARQVRLPVPPEKITISYLRALVRFLNQGDWVDETAEIKERIERKRLERK